MGYTVYTNSTQKCLTIYDVFVFVLRGYNRAALIEVLCFIEQFRHEIVQIKN